MNLWNMLVEWSRNKIAEDWEEIASILNKLGETIEKIVNNIVNFMRQ